MYVIAKSEISPEILQNAAKEEPTIESQERDQQKIECISHLVSENKKERRDPYYFNNVLKSPFKMQWRKNLPKICPQMIYVWRGPNGTDLISPFILAAK